MPKRMRGLTLLHREERKKKQEGRREERGGVPLAGATSSATPKPTKLEFGLLPTQPDRRASPEKAATAGKVSRKCWPEFIAAENSFKQPPCQHSSGQVRSPMARPTLPVHYYQHR